MIATLANGAKNTIVQAAIDNLFKDSEEVNISYEGDFGPVNEIGSRVPVEVIEGAIPSDFPTGIYIRNGPNPQFGGKIKESPFGKLIYHWFEGDGMLHATHFGENGTISYQNKYVETEGYKEEKKQGKALWLNALHGHSNAILMAYLFNQKPDKKCLKLAGTPLVIYHDWLAVHSCHLQFEESIGISSSLGYDCECS
ncbi:hypothetical protein L7F22_018886 [Adiantum nelumboides]|nr:hypothetical protein [Adiantum nelumboides]